MTYKKIGIIGADNTGKRTIGRELAKLQGVEVIEVTDYEHTKSAGVRFLGHFGNFLTKSGDVLYNNSREGLGKFVANAGYGYKLLLYATYGTLSQRRQHTVYMRYPPIESRIYEETYLVGGNELLLSLEKYLVKLFSKRMGLDMLIYLRANADSISSRFKDDNRQIHESKDSLEGLVDKYETTFQELQAEGRNIHPVDTDDTPLEEVVAKVLELVQEEINA